MSCQAEQYFMEEARERGMSPRELENEWIYDCSGALPGYSHGFIFRDGSIIDIGIYEDHRVIPIDEWNEMNLVTYTVTNGECDFRVNGYLTWAEAEMMADICMHSGCLEVYIDVYDADDHFRGTISISGYYPSANEIYQRVFGVI